MGLFFKFLNRYLPIFPKERVVLKPKEQKLIKVEAPFIDEISGLAIIKILDGSPYSTILIKLKFTCNAAILDILNNGTETIIFIPKEMIGIVDLRSLGYYKINKAYYNRIKASAIGLIEQRHSVKILINL